MAAVNGNIEMQSQGSLVRSGSFEMQGMASMNNLNNLLIEYIKAVQELEARQANSDGIPRRETTINVNINRTKLIEMSTKYEPQLTEWKNKCRAADDQIAELMAKIAQLEAEIKFLMKKNSDKEDSIRDKDLTIERLRAEISKLEANLSLAQNQKQIFDVQLKGLEAEIENIRKSLKLAVDFYSGEKKKGSELAAKLTALEKELRFQISILGSEIETENKSVNFDMSRVDEKIKDHYKIKMDGQLEQLGKMYKQYTEACTVDLEKLYTTKITELENHISQIPKPIENSEELQLLQIQLESCRLKSRELEANNLDLFNKQTTLEADIKEKEEYYKDQKTAKDNEIEMIKRENEEIRKKCEKLRQEMDFKQVKKYSDILTPEISRVSSQFGMRYMVENKKSLNFSVSEESRLTIKELGSDSDSGMEKSFASLVTKDKARKSSSSSSDEEKETAKSVTRNKAGAGAVARSGEAVISKTGISAGGGAGSRDAVNQEVAITATKVESAATAATAAKTETVVTAAKQETVVTAVKETIQTTSNVVTTQKEMTTNKKVSQSSSKKSGKKN